MQDVTATQRAAVLNVCLQCIDFVGGLRTQQKWIHLESLKNTVLGKYSCLVFFRSGLDMSPLLS